MQIVDLDLLRVDCILHVIPTILKLCFYYLQKIETHHDPSCVKNCQNMSKLLFQISVQSKVRPIQGSRIKDESSLRALNHTNMTSKPDLGCPQQLAIVAK